MLWVQNIRGNWVKTMLVLSAVACMASTEARADHSLGRTCISCHSLRSSNVVPGSRNVLKDRVNDPLYKTPAWYCGGNWADSAGVQALDCSYCHETDIALEFQAAYGGKHNPGPGVGSAHPVDVIGDGVTYAVGTRIVCNDCHNGGAPPALTPETLCTKSATDGYPNHLGVVVSPASPPGVNNLVNNPPHLTYAYGSEFDWAKATFAANDMLCFVCHDKNTATKPPFSQNIAEGSMTDIMGAYNAVGGGHNISGIGNNATARRVPCYECHDPHSATDPDNVINPNKALMLNVELVGLKNPYDPNNTFSIAGYNGTNDRALCIKCHGGTGVVEGTAVITVQNPILSSNLKFGYHSGAHAEAATSGNCLQKNGGCHGSVHNTSPYDCLSCHSTSALVVSSSNTLKRVANVDSELGHLPWRYDVTGKLLDGTQYTAAPAKGNGILNQHNIPYNPSGNLAAPADNGCLSCHNVAGNVARVVGLPDATTFAPPDMSNRENLKAYDGFCIGCHDGSLGAGESFGTLKPPVVSKYFMKGGHGTGLGSDSFISGNTLAKVPCLECHLYHGSTANKLLPGNVQTTDGIGRVVKAFDYSANPIGPLLSTGTKFSVGGVPNTLRIDYVDYTLSGSGHNTLLTDDKRKALKFADYTNSAPWSTYYESAGNSPLPTDPMGTPLSFGTSGNYFDSSRTKTLCGTDDATNTTPIGFCDTCHFYNNSTDGTASTFGKASTHQSVVNGKSCAAKDTKSKINMLKDCTECHDPHGSGANSSDDPNLYMVRGKVVTGFDTTWDTYNIVFKSSTAYDTADLDNRDEICAVCHTATSHNKRESPPANDHMVGSNCIQCHPHGKGTATDNGANAVGFGQGQGCNVCHGYPPVPTYVTGTVVYENYTGGGGYHDRHVAFLEQKTSTIRDNFPTSELCGPCHGESAGSSNHTVLPACGVGAWAENPCRGQVTLRDRDTPAFSWATPSYYGGTAMPTNAAAAAMTVANSTCRDSNCHGQTQTSDHLSWFDDSDPTQSGQNRDTTSNFSDGLVRSQTCKGCHDETPAAQLRVWNGTRTLVYTGTARNVAANYFGTLSGYGRGGHGDARLSTAGLDVNSSTYDTPIDCTACHAPNSAHFPPDSGNLHRLSNTTIENDNHTFGGLCNASGCHTGAIYPGQTINLSHHPSYYTTGRGAVAPNPAQEIMQPVNSFTTWTENPPSSGHFEQNAYGAANYSGNPDTFIDWYDRGTSWTPGGENHLQSSPRGVFLGEDGATVSTDSPKATLPVERYVINNGTSTRVMCVTCHNPHGTDLFIYDPTGAAKAGKDIADHNMLRLQDTDNTLCDACH